MCVSEGVLDQWLADLVSQDSKRAGRTMLVWRAEPGACKECMKFNGRRFSHRPDFWPLHKNCKCTLEPA